MSLPSTYSRRKRQAAGSTIDVYNYAQIPNKVRVQVVHVLTEALGGYRVTRDGANLKENYDIIVKQLRKEFGVHSLTKSFTLDSQQELFSWLQEETEIDHWLDGLEICLRVIDILIRRDWTIFCDAVYTNPDAAIVEINARLQEAAVGYQYISKDIIRIDSLFVHNEIVVPALTLLRDQRFAAAEQEYRDAHEAYRHGKLEDCIVACGKAFESVLKVIAAKRSWLIKDTDPASRLIQAAVDAGFLASYSQASLNHLKGLMESSTPTVRNKQGGHGAGTTPRAVPNHLAAFQLHQTAAVIIFLVEQDAAIP
jgi:hypothetical protein